LALIKLLAGVLGHSYALVPYLDRRLSGDYNGCPGSMSDTTVAASDSTLP
jgi:hypothetical protein